MIYWLCFFLLINPHDLPAKPEFYYAGPIPFPKGNGTVFNLGDPFDRIFNLYVWTDTKEIIFDGRTNSTYLVLSKKPIEYVFGQANYKKEDIWIIKFRLNKIETKEYTLKEFVELQRQAVSYKQLAERILKVPIRKINNDKDD